MKNYAALFIILANALPAFCGGTGSAALSFLKLDCGARAAGMGGAYSAVGDDSFSVFYNPAGVSFMDRKELALAHNMWLSGMTHENAAYVQPLGAHLTAFAGLNMLLSGKMTEYDALGNASGSFSARESALTLGLSGMLTRNLFAAAAVKSLNQSAAGSSASAWAADAGLMATTGDLRAGLSVSNLGSPIKYGATAFPLPLIIRGGLARNFNQELWLTADWIQNSDSGGSAAIGSEWEYEMSSVQSFFLRAGYRTGRAEETGSGLTCGAGLRSTDLRLDYAFTPYGELGTAHRFSLSLAFGGIREALKKKRSNYPRTYEDYKRNDPVSKRKKQAEQDAEIRKNLFTW